MQSDSQVSSSFSDDKNKSISPIEERLISILKDGGPLTRDQLVQKMDVPRTTVYDGLKKLIDRNEVKKYPFYLVSPRCNCPTNGNRGYVKYHEPGCEHVQPNRGRPRVLFSLLDDRK